MKSPWAQLTEVAVGQQASPSALPVTQALSPFAPTSQLETIVWSDIVGSENVPMNRAQAIRVPAVARARHIVAGTVAGLPLTVWRDDQQLVGEDWPSWTYRTDAGISPYHRMLWTVDDLIFYGWSLWGVRRGFDDAVLDAVRVPFDKWSFDADGRVLVGGEGVPSSQVVLIPGAHEGIVNFGAQPIREAADLAQSARDAAANPSAYLNLHYTGDKPMTDPEIDAVVARWSAARKGRNGGVSFTSKNLEAKEMGAHGEHLLTAGRNAASVDMARLVGIPAALLDATTAQASLTYETTEGRNAEFIDYGLALYLDPIKARLSMDDVVPRGQSTRFDTTQLRSPAPSPTGPDTKD